MRSPNRPGALSLFLNAVFLLLIIALLLIYFQPTPTAGIARLRAEHRYQCPLTQETACISLSDGAPLWNPAQAEGARLLSDQRCYLGRSGRRYAAIVTQRYLGQLQWDAAPTVYLIDPVPELPLTTNLYLEAEDLAVPAGYRYVFGVVQDPDIVRVKLTYQGIGGDIYSVETREFYDGMFLLYPGSRFPSGYTLTAYDAGGELVFRDSRWYGSPPQQVQKMVWNKVR